MFECLQAWLEEYRTKLSDVAGVKLENKDAPQEQAGGAQPVAPPAPSAEGVQLWMFAGRLAVSCG
jgi:hypothetical protein